MALVRILLRERLGQAAGQRAFAGADDAADEIAHGKGVESSSLKQEHVLLQPLLWVAIYRFGAAETDKLILNAGLITMAIFVGLTATVFITKKDFSFLRGILMVLTFAALGVMIASWIFGFQLGAIWCALVIALMAGYILYETSSIMRDFPPTFHVAAALMLFSTVATLFIYVLRLLASLRE